MSDNNFKKAVLYMWKSVQTGNHNNINALLTPEFPVDTPLTDGGMTGLHIAWSRGDFDAAEIFLNGGADILKADKLGRSALHFAASIGTNLDLIEALVTKGADVNAQSSGGETPLMKAIAFDNADAAKVLLEKGADAELENTMNRNSFSFAKASKNEEILAALGIDSAGDAEMS
jgi:ankyrin repeat protein